MVMFQEKKKGFLVEIRGVWEQYIEDFKEADTGEDGLLNLAELKKFFEINHERKLARGLPT